MQNRPLPLIQVITFILVSFLFTHCVNNPEKTNDETDTVTISKEIEPDGSRSENESNFNPIEHLEEHTEIADTSFLFLKDWSETFSYDMKYATTDNFIGKRVYDCSACMIRKEVAIALMKANEEFEGLGYHIKFFDCYRPVDVQKIMWEVYPVEGYVANPYKGGSNHNRGGAVDITLVDENNNELNMGTGFDYFGEEAHHDYQNLPAEVIQNREILKSIMEKFGFRSINTEWWHYNFKNSRNYPLSNFQTDCNS